MKSIPMPKEEKPIDRSIKTTEWSSDYLSQSRYKKLISVYKLSIDLESLSMEIDHAISAYRILNEKPATPAATLVKASYNKIVKHADQITEELEALSLEERLVLEMAARDIAGFNEQGVQSPQTGAALFFEPALQAVQPNFSCWEARSGKH